MTTFSIFWDSLFAMVFFVLGVIFRGLSSIFSALEYAVKSVFVVLGWLVVFMVAVLGVYEVFLCLTGASNENIFGLIFSIAVLLMVTKYLVMGLFPIILMGIFELISDIVGWFSSAFEKRYGNYLAVINTRLDRN